MGESSLNASLLSRLSLWLRPDWTRTVLARRVAAGGLVVLAGIATLRSNPADDYAQVVVADHDLRKAYRNGNFPEQFNVTNIAPAGPNMAQADVGITGPKFAGPVNKHLVFVNQNGNWVLQHDAALALVQAATATN